MHLHTKALVLRETAHKESDKILTLFPRSRGSSPPPPGAAAARGALWRRAAAAAGVVGFYSL